MEDLTFGDIQISGNEVRKKYNEKPLIKLGFINKKLTILITWSHSTI